MKKGQFENYGRKWECIEMVRLGITEDCGSNSCGWE